MDLRQPTQQESTILDQAKALRELSEALHLDFNSVLLRRPPTDESEVEGNPLVPNVLDEIINDLNYAILQFQDLRVRFDGQLRAKIYQAH